MKSFTKTNANTSLYRMALSGRIRARIEQTSHPIFYMQCNAATLPTKCKSRITHHEEVHRLKSVSFAVLTKGIEFRFDINKWVILDASKE